MGRAQSVGAGGSDRGSILLVERRPGGSSRLWASVGAVAKRRLEGDACLSQRPRQPDADPRRKVRFREAARDIVARDRNDRKYGLAVDTAGAIARALERAYRQGYEDAQSDPPIGLSEPVDEDGALDWVMIPPRPRTAFWTLCLFALGREKREERSGHLVPVLTERFTPGWQLVLSDGRFEKTLGEKTVLPLVRLGLLALAPDPPERLVISERGIATWRLFLQRGGQYPEDLTQV